MKTVIARIEKQLARLQETYPCDDFAGAFFNEGASEEDFARLEAVLGYALPEDFKALYRLHDGEAEEANGVLQGEEWLSIARIVDEYTIWKELYEGEHFRDDAGKDYGCEPDAGIRPDFWWNPRWISLTANGAGDSKMIDLDPAEGGQVGQVIQMWHDDSRRSKEAASLREFFGQYADDLEAGKYVLHPDYGVVAKEDLDAEELAEIGL